MPRDPTEPSIVSAIGLTSEVNSSDSLVREDKRFITETLGPMVLSPGEVFDIVNTKEKGELVYVKIVTDNPYAAVYLELDDYRNKEPNGETAAQLIYEGRTTKSDNQFFAIDGDPSKGYSLVYNPMRAEAYDYRIKLQVSNRITASSEPFGNSLRSIGRQGLPSPARPIHMAGGSFTYPGLGAANLETFAGAIAKPVGAQPYAAPSVYNAALFTQENLEVGAHSPYQGLAGKPVFRRFAPMLNTSAKGAVTIDNTELAAAEIADASTNGIKVLFGTQHPSGSDPENFPGTPTSPSTMTLTFVDNTEADASTLGEFANHVGKRVFIRNGDTMYFPGVITAQANITSGTRNQMTVSPGLANLPAKIAFTQDSESFTAGTLETEAIVPKIQIKQIIVKRRKLVSYEG